MTKNLFSLLLLINFMHNIRSECLSNSFEIIPGITTGSERSITTFIKVTTNQTNPNEYTTNCLDYLEITAKSINDLRREKYNMSPELINQTFNYSFNSLNVLSDYNISIGLKIKNNDEIFSKLDVNYFTCFSQSGPPENLEAIKVNNDLLNLKWNEPSNINAPNICYYSITRRFLDESKKIEYKTNQTFFSFSGADLKRDFEILISSYNDVECYKQNYPVAVKCENKGFNKTSSSSVSYIFYANKDPSTTTKPNSSPSLKYNYYLILFFGMIFLIF
ncbi:unnamed protein product [Brachionus calyciflorus]|uniref:Fibronectin type-III domain-containing protein n=1 Tax=Brachionus calyciflorus TaxID=104777 RepID=A0A814HSS5_9BILA|nr:unnamed protein product [Brachionus calyciflorus]